MFEYESMRVLFEFLVVPINNNKHWSNIWLVDLAKFMHQ